MEAKTTQKYIKMSPRKLRLVADMVRELTPSEAVKMLPYVKKRAAKPLEKAIKTAMANAKQKGAKEEELVFGEIQISDGPRLKRGRPVARGQWHPVLKRWSHIRVVLKTEESGKKVDKKEKKREVQEGGKK